MSVAYFKVLSRYSPKSLGESVSILSEDMYLVSQQRFEPVSPEV
jgi:hypothetical protein